MKHFLPILFIFSFNLVSPLLAQDKKCANMSALLENKIWKVQLPKDKQYAMEMEFRSAGWRTTFLYDENKPKHSIPILCMEIQSKFLNRVKIISFKNLQIVL